MKHFKCSNIDIITSQSDQETLMLSPDKAYGHPDVYYQDGHNMAITVRIFMQLWNNFI